MTSFATPNLPSRDLEATHRFYAGLGFKPLFFDDGWMILERSGIRLEFFPHPDLDPLASWFSCCLRLDDLDGFYAICRNAGIVEANSGQPRLHRPVRDGGGPRMAALVDPDGTLLRLIQN